MKFSKFMASTTGRITRIVAGLILIALGALLWSGWGVVLIIVGLVPLGRVDQAFWCGRRRVLMGDSLRDL